MRKNYKILIRVLLLIFTINVFPINKPHIINIYREKYHAANKNWAIGQDENGTMYFGNDVGLLEYDGIEWKLSQLPKSRLVRSLAVLSDKTVFTGGYEEFGRWDRDISGQLKYTSLSDGLNKSVLKNNDFWKIWVVKDKVYFQSFTSIFVYDQDGLRQISPGDSFLFLAKVGEQLIVQKMGGALYLLNEERLDKIEGSDFFNNTDVRVILPYTKGGYLLGTATKGIYIYDGKSFSEWNKSLSSITSTKELNCGILTSRGTYYLGTILDGIYEVNEQGEILNQISSENMLQNNTILSLYEDNLNNIWAALDRGIAYIQYIENMSCFTDIGGNTGAVYDATIWNNKFFIGTNQGAFYIDEKDMSATNPLSNMKLINGTQGQVWSFSIIDDKLYCGHNRGIKAIDKNMQVTVPYQSAGVYDIIKTTFGNRDVLLLSTYVSLAILDNTTGKSHHLSAISEPIVKSEIDHLGNIWLEHANRGIYRCQISENLENIEYYSYYGGDSNDGLPYKMKMFKVGGRIVLLGNDKFYTYDDIADSIVPNAILNECFVNIRDLKRVVAIDKNTFWALAGSSIYKFSYDGYRAQILESYNLGMNLSLVNSYENISVVNDSISIVCLDNGYLLYDKSKYGGDTHFKLLSPYLESLQIADTHGKFSYINLSEPAEIPSKYNNVTFYFSVQDMFASNYAVQYMLKGVDNEWSTPQRINKVSYARLAEGRYSLMIRSVDNIGNFSDTVSYEFEVLPPWYNTTWAYMVYILIFVTISYIVWLLILRRYRNLHLQKIRFRETKRLRILADELQNEIEQKKAELLTQTSSIVHKNELLLKIKDIVSDLDLKNKGNISSNQKINALLNNNLNSDDDWKMFLIKFEEKHTGFFKRLKELYPQLTNTDLRLCACLRLNLETKEIASLMNLSIRTVENNRYRLRKKLNIASTQNLIEFFLSKNI